MVELASPFDLLIESPRDICKAFTALSIKAPVPAALVLARVRFSAQDLVEELVDERLIRGEVNF